MANLNMNMAEYDRLQKLARGIFYGVPGKPVETDLGVEVPWETAPDRELAIFQMECLLYDMLFDLIEHIDETEK